MKQVAFSYGPYVANSIAATQNITTSTGGYVVINGTTYSTRPNNGTALASDGYAVIPGYAGPYGEYQTIPGYGDDDMGAYQVMYGQEAL